MGNLTLKELGRRAFETAKAKGFHDEPIDIPRALMLTVSELAEALEADRKNKRAELADATIRLLDLSTALGIDLEMHVLLKMQYNEGRGYKHGKRY